jgi:hypothetical protein
MLASPSFFAEKVQPSAYENISRAMSRTGDPTAPVSRSLMR